MKMSVTYVDPPSGWQYGFPKEYTLDLPDDLDEVERERRVHEWFVANGYPQREIDAGMLRYCRSWTKTIDVDMGDNAS